MDDTRAARVHLDRHALAVEITPQVEPQRQAMLAAHLDRLASEHVQQEACEEVRLGSFGAALRPTRDESHRTAKDTK